MKDPFSKDDWLLIKHCLLIGTVMAAGLLGLLCLGFYISELIYGA